MHFDTSIQLDNRPALGQCTNITVETGIQTLSRIVVEVSEYEDDSENCQGIDLDFGEMIELSKMLAEFSGGRKEPYRLTAAWQQHHGKHHLSLSPGIEGMVALKVCYTDAAEEIDNRILSALLTASECVPLAYAVRACGESRQMADEQIQANKEIGLDN